MIAMTTKTTKKKVAGKEKKKKGISRETALARHYRRPTRARIRDECEFNKKIGKDPTQAWSDHPSASDVLGIDIPTEIDKRGNMTVSKKAPDVCLAGANRDPDLAKKLKGRKINPIYDPNFEAEKW